MYRPPLEPRNKRWIWPALSPDMPAVADHHPPVTKKLRPATRSMVMRQSCGCAKVEWKVFAHVQREGEVFVEAITLKEIRKALVPENLAPPGGSSAENK